MEQNKYYCPKIEEFRVGFRYQRYDYDNVTDTYYWNKCKIEYWENLRDIYDLLGDTLDGKDGNILISKIRVKYLDKKDIESLGFKLYIKNNFIYCQYKELEIYLDYNIETNICKIYTLDENLFKGVINNKSELQVVLKQLEIK